MATTAAPSSSSIDLRTKATYPVRLGASILKSADSRKYTTVRYNHTLKLRNPKDARCTLRTVDADEEDVTLRDGKDEYKYTGRPVDSDNWFVLVSKGSGRDADTVLERVGACHDLNLTRTPLETDAAKLAEQFQHLPVDDEDDLFGDEDEPADPKNPWDYRNYMKPTTSKPRDRHALARVSGGASTPSAQRPANSTPISRPVKQSQGPLTTQKKRKVETSTKDDPKRVKAGTEPSKPATSSTSRMQNVPKVRIDRKASLRRPSIDDSGELIIENETPISERPPKRSGAMALALSGQLGQGPISLRSAANSPASLMAASPMPQRPDGIADGEEFEFGGSSSPETTTKKPSQQQEDDYFGTGDEDDGGDADADVEDLELPSPAQTHRKPVAATGPVDDEDDLDKQLALAMAEDDDVAVPAAAVVESDEESEEE